MSYFVFFIPLFFCGICSALLVYVFRNILVQEKNQVSNRASKMEIYSVDDGDFISFSDKERGASLTVNNEISNNQAKVISTPKRHFEIDDEFLFRNVNLTRKNYFPSSTNGRITALNSNSCRNGLDFEWKRYDSKPSKESNIIRIENVLVEDAEKAY